MKNYKKYILRYLPYFILGPLLMLTEVGGEIVLPKLMAGMIDIGIANHDSAFIVERGLTMLLSILVMITGGVLGHYFSIKAAVNFAADLRADVFKKVQRFSFKNIDKFSTDSLVTRLTNDITQLQNLTRMTLIMAMRSPGMLVGGMIMAISINMRLAGVLAVVLPILVAAIIAVLKIGYPRFEKMQRTLDALNARIQENITNVRVIKSFVRTNYEIKKFLGANSDLKGATLSAMNIVIVTMPLMTLAMNITTLAVVWLGGRFVVAGSMEIGELTAFTTYIVQILMSLMMVSQLILQFSRAAASSNRICEVLNTKIDLTDDNAKFPDKNVGRGEVEFKNVCFKYHMSDKENILKNINIKIEAASTVGIIGITGSGKSSLVGLIPRLYDVTEGEILVDGVNVKDYSIKRLRSGVAMVLQKNVLFSGTIEDNLRWGDENATEEELHAAARAAQAEEFLGTFTNGYQTELGQGGVNVSGGQKQRLCIARALLKKPKILILDDSTSAVDTATEAKIRQSFGNELKDTTKIIIAQRISSVMEADRIFVLDDGRICAQGTHDELMANSEDYRNIYYSQMDKEVSA